MTIHVFASLNPKPEYREQALAALYALVNSTRQEPGNIQYDLFEGAGEDSSFYLIEAYTDSIAFDAHRQTDHYIKYRNKATHWLVDAPIVKIFNPIDIAYIARE